jgi:hypothetical protein
LCGTFGKDEIGVLVHDLQNAPKSQWTHLVDGFAPGPQPGKINVRVANQIELSFLGEQFRRQAE